MKDFRLDLQAASGLINTGIREKAYKSWESLMREYTTGGGMLGWVDVPANWQCNDYARLEEFASVLVEVIWAHELQSRPSATVLKPTSKTIHIHKYFLPVRISVKTTYTN